jgi:hypothetical protein
MQQIIPDNFQRRQAALYFLFGAFTALTPDFRRPDAYGFAEISDII